MWEEEHPQERVVLGVINARFTECAHNLLTTHKVVNHRIDGAVGVAEPVREQREHRDHLILSNVNRVSGDGSGEGNGSVKNDGQGYCAEVILRIFQAT